MSHLLVCLPENIHVIEICFGPRLNIRYVDGTLVQKSNLARGGGKQLVCDIMTFSTVVVCFMKLIKAVNLIVD